jgi:deoxyribodipyrimidine photo-lyase
MAPSAVLKGRKTVAHFLVFDMAADWRVGAFYFEEVLLDYDCAMNYGNWVTVARIDRRSSRPDPFTAVPSRGRR